MKKKEKIIYVVGIIVLIVTIIIGTSYSLWSITKTQETENVIVVGEYVNSCISVTFEEAIEELRTYPKTDEEGKKTSPLRFTIKNECGYITEYEIHLEVLSTTTMSKEVVKAVLDNNEPKKVNEYTSTESVIKNATAHVLENNILGIEEERSYNFRKWIDEEASQAEVTDKVFDTKISIVSNEYISETNYAYTGSVQEFTVPYTGYYNIELWGASGGGANSSAYGALGYGGYTSGEIYFEKNEQIYIYVGEQGKTTTYNYSGPAYGAAAAFNGGGAGGNGQTANTSYPWGTYLGGNSGGGATDTRYFGNYNPTTTELQWNSTLGLRSRIMVAGAGGGVGDVNLAGQTGSNLGLTGSRGTSVIYEGTNFWAYGGTGATQTSGYSFGAGATGSNSYSGAACPGHNGGGGGYYGGSGGLYHPTGYCFRFGGGGGSSFISGHTGSNAINASGAHTGQTNHYSGKTFSNSTLTGQANLGNGKAKITFISK